jgi:hypothetical protein
MYNDVMLPVLHWLGKQKSGEGIYFNVKFINLPPQTDEITLKSYIIRKTNNKDAIIEDICVYGDDDNGSTLQAWVQSGDVKTI